MISNTAVSKRDGRGKNARNRGKLSHSLLKKKLRQITRIGCAPGKVGYLGSGKDKKKWKLPVTVQGHENGKGGMNIPGERLGSDTRCGSGESTPALRFEVELGCLRRTRGRC